MSSGTGTFCFPSNLAVTHPDAPRPYPVASAKEKVERAASKLWGSLQVTCSVPSARPKKTKIFLPTFATVSPQGWSVQASG